MSQPDSSEHHHHPERLIPIEEALDRRLNHHGVVEYLVKLHNIDKMEWVPWNKIHCPQLMDTHDSPVTSSTTANTSTTAQSNNGIFDV